MKWSSTLSKCFAACKNFLAGPAAILNLMPRSRPTYYEEWTTPESIEISLAYLSPNRLLLLGKLCDAPVQCLVNFSVHLHEFLGWSRTLFPWSATF